MRVLSPHFFRSKDTVSIARSLLGKVIIRRRRGRGTHYIITEVEAYDGPHDRASHASRGRTLRNHVMFGPAGCWYIYFVYGMHYMLNVVTGPEEYPAAILIRGVAGVTGPGRLTKALSITKSMNGKRASPVAGLYVADAGIRVPGGDVKALPRVGVYYAGPLWAGKKYRFVYTPLL